MNHRRVLRISTDVGLLVFILMIVGVILWTTDEVLNWNILPDWIDAYAQLLVIIFSILAGFAVVISLMCGFSIIAESAAERAGIPNPPTSRRLRVLVSLGCILALTFMFGLHKIDQHRQNKRIARQREEHKQRYYKHQGILKARIPGVVAGFMPDVLPSLLGRPSGASDAALAQLLNAVHISTPLAPTVSVIIPVESPYQYCILKVPDRNRHPRPPESEILSRDYLIDLPKVWERNTIGALFKGKELTVPHSRRGAFFDTWQPSAWGYIRDGEDVIGIVMLRSTERLN